MGLFGKSFKEKVEHAADVLGKSGLGVHNLTASINGKVVTLEGQAESEEAKMRVMREFNRMAAPKSIVNRIQVSAAPAAAPQTPRTPAPPPASAPPVSAAPPAPAAPAAAPEAAQTTIYEVKPGDTLGAIAQRFYGKASLYMKIFEANTDILTNPDLIKVGQKLKIPKPD